MEDGDEEVSLEELASNLSTYKEQLQHTRQLLENDPRNLEYLNVEKELIEVISLTEELLVTAKQNENVGLSVGTTGDQSSSFSLNVNFSQGVDHSGKFPVGSKVQVVWSEDGEWYNATVDTHTTIGYYVYFDEWGNMEEVDPDKVRAIDEREVDPLLEAEKIAHTTKEALKRKIAQAATIDFQSKTLPAKLRIEHDDPEDVKDAKKKRIHSFKSKMRIEKLELSHFKRQNVWQQFQTTKGRAKKPGFFSGRKRESIFKSPEDPRGKVGVTGSGKGLTNFQKRDKYINVKGVNAEDGED